ncbi:hypothetical protein OIU78_029722 [Salix suchowensis]|nr:hypothetical protein OIU78_029722 [Salix suchowensis]
MASLHHKALDSISVSDIEALGIPASIALKLYKDVSEIINTHGPSSPQTWTLLSKRLLHPLLPFSFHQMMYYGCFKDFGTDPPAWSPDPEAAMLTNVGQFLERRGKELLGSTYKDPISSFSHFQEFSVSNPEVYWKHCGQWLPGAYVNPAKTCLTVNCKRTLDDVVIRWRDEGNDDMPVSSMTLEELRSEVWLVAHALNALGLDRGSAIAIDMPMNMESVAIYLAIVLAGHVVVSIADSFAPPEISTRLKISEAKAIFTQDLIIRGDKRIPLYSRVVHAQAPMAIVIPTKGCSFSMNLRDGDISWHDFIEKATGLRGDEFAAVEQPVEAFSNILFSSGTTGEPKAIPWTHMTPFKAAADAWCHMDIRKGDIVAWPTNLGWMMGPLASICFIIKWGVHCFI